MIHSSQMRIVNHKITVRSILFSKPAGFIYFLVMIFFVYKCITLLPIWLTTKDKAEQARIDYEKKVQMVAEKNEQIQNGQTDIGKERYQKDFFNKLDEGENLIILYKDEEVKKSDNEGVRKMFWWEEQKQNFLVWWRNLEILKK